MEKPKVKLYKAICMDTLGGYFESNHFFSTEEEAKAWLEGTYIGLHTSGSCIEIRGYKPIFPNPPKFLVEPLLTKQEHQERQKEKDLQERWDQFMSPHIKD